MDDLLHFAKTCEHLRKISSLKKFRYPPKIREQAVELTKKYHIDEVAFQLEISSLTINSWKKSLEVTSIGSFSKVTISNTESQRETISDVFEVMINGNHLKFPETPDAKWFARLLNEVRLC